MLFPAHGTVSMAAEPVIQRQVIPTRTKGKMSRNGLPRSVTFVPPMTLKRSRNAPEPAGGCRAWLTTESVQIKRLCALHTAIGLLLQVEVHILRVPRHQGQCCSPFSPSVVGPGNQTQIIGLMRQIDAFAHSSLLSSPQYFRGIVCTERLRMLH